MILFILLKRIRYFVVVPASINSMRNIDMHWLSHACLERGAKIVDNLQSKEGLILFFLADSFFLHPISKKGFLKIIEVLQITYFGS